MKIGLELIANHPIMLRLGTFLETWVATPSGTVKRSLSRDEYHLTLTINTGKRLAATGRTHICQLDLERSGLGPNQARGAMLTEVDAPPGTPLIWGIRTNLFLDLAALKEGVTVRMIREGTSPLAFGLDHPLLIAEEVAPGRYILDLSGILYTEVS